MQLMQNRDSIARAGIQEKTLTLLVKEKVSEIMANRDGILLNLFFVAARLRMS